MNNTKYAMKYSNDNETCDTLQFEYNIMKNIQSENNMKTYYLTNLHNLIPWIEWHETNRFTRKTERKCALIMEQIENVKTFEGVIQKSYPPSFEYDNGLIKFLINCYNELIIGLERLHLFNYYHIDINGVNILVWPRHNIINERICYLIDYGGVFAMNYDAKTDKYFTGKSHNYSPYAYYNLYEFELREQIKFNLTKLNYFAVKDNQYRIIVELIRFYLEYVELETELETYTENEYEYIKNAKDKQHEIVHVKPVGIDTNNQTYIQLIWCLRQIQIRLCILANTDDIPEHRKHYFQWYYLYDNRNILQYTVTNTKLIDIKLEPMNNIDTHGKIISNVQNPLINLPVINLYETIAVNASQYKNGYKIRLKWAVSIPQNNIKHFTIKYKEHVNNDEKKIIFDEKAGEDEWIISEYNIIKITDNNAKFEVDIINNFEYNQQYQYQILLNVLNSIAVIIKSNIIPSMITNIVRLKLHSFNHRAHYFSKAYHPQQMLNNSGQGYGSAFVNNFKPNETAWVIFKCTDCKNNESFDWEWDEKMVFI